MATSCKVELKQKMATSCLKVEMRMKASCCWTVEMEIVKASRQVREMDQQSSLSCNLQSKGHLETTWALIHPKVLV